MHMHSAWRVYGVPALDIERYSGHATIILLYRAISNELNVSWCEAFNYYTFSRTAIGRHK